MPGEHEQFHLVNGRIERHCAGQAGFERQIGDVKGARRGGFGLIDRDGCGVCGERRDVKGSEGKDQTATVGFGDGFFSCPKLIEGIAALLGVVDGEEREVF